MIRQNMRHPCLREPSTLEIHCGAQLLTEKGMEIYSPTAVEMKQFKEKTQAAVIPYIRSQVGDQWVDKVIEAAQKATQAYYAE